MRTNERFLAIDRDGIVRVYRREPAGGVHEIGEWELVSPQPDDTAEQLEHIRMGTLLAV